MLESEAVETADMSSELVRFEHGGVALADRNGQPPAIVAEAGDAARFAYAEFFQAELDNEHTHRAYRRAVNRFLDWCDACGLELHRIAPAHVGEYVRTLTTEPRRTRAGKVLVKPASKPMQKLHLAAIRQFFDRLVVRHVVVLNPAASVRGPKHTVSEGKTPAISPEQARAVLQTIETRSVVGLRDRAIVATMIYTAARAGAVAKLRLGDFYTDGRQWFFRFDEKGGKVRDIPCRHDLEGYVQEYIAAAGIAADDASAPLFRTARGKTRALTRNGVRQKDVLRMVKRRFKEAGLPAAMLTCHTFRATTITDLLTQGVPLEDVQHLAGHADPRTTRLYDRRKREVTRNIVERISI